MDSIVKHTLDFTSSLLSEGLAMSTPVKHALDFSSSLLCSGFTKSIPFIIERSLDLIVFVNTPPPAPLVDLFEIHMADARAAINQIKLIVTEFNVIGSQFNLYIYEIRADATNLAIRQTELIEMLARVTSIELEISNLMDSAARSINSANTTLSPTRS